MIGTLLSMLWGTTGLVIAVMLVCYYAYYLHNENIILHHTIHNLKCKLELDTSDDEKQSGFTSHAKKGINTVDKLAKDTLGVGLKEMVLNK